MLQRISYLLLNAKIVLASLQVNVKRSIKGKDSALSVENGNASHAAKILKPPIVRRGKLVIVDLAGSERIDKSGNVRQTESLGEKSCCFTHLL